MEVGCLKVMVRGIKVGFFEPTGAEVVIMSFQYDIYYV